MSGYFQKQFAERLLPPGYEFEPGEEKPEDTRSLDEVIVDATETVAAIEQIKELPERNQKLIADMTELIVRQVNAVFSNGNDWRANYWGLYIVGSRARGEAEDDSDLDLLSVGTFYRRQGFAGSWGEYDDHGVFAGFGVSVPEELPDEYNVGSVERKYLVHAEPTDDGVLPVDLVVADMTHMKVDLEGFKDEHDVSTEGSPLQRIPLVEVETAERPPLVWKP